MPPEVGYADTSSDIHSPMIRMKTETIGQPQAIAAGPPLFQPRPNEVKQPARIEMIENEMAKLEKPGPGPVQFLGVAELREVLFVLVEQFVTLGHGGSPSPTRMARERHRALTE